MKKIFVDIVCVYITMPESTRSVPDYKFPVTVYIFKLVYLDYS